MESFYNPIYNFFFGYHYIRSFSKVLLSCAVDLEFLKFGVLVLSPHHSQITSCFVDICQLPPLNPILPE